MWFGSASRDVPAPSQLFRTSHHRHLPLPSAAEEGDAVVQQLEAEGAEGVAAVSRAQAGEDAHAHLAAEVAAGVAAVAAVVAVVGFGPAALFQAVQALGAARSGGR